VTTCQCYLCRTVCQQPREECSEAQDLPVGVPVTGSGDRLLGGDRSAVRDVGRNVQVSEPSTSASDYVCVPVEEFKRLTQRDEELGQLEAWGVDNWEAYGDALSGRGPDD
jgi:hypothetical protein